MCVCAQAQAPKVCFVQNMSWIQECKIKSQSIILNQKRRLEMERYFNNKIEIEYKHEYYP